MCTIEHGKVCFPTKSRAHGHSRHFICFILLRFPKLIGGGARNMALNFIFNEAARPSPAARPSRDLAHIASRRWRLLVCPLSLLPCYCSTPTPPFFGPHTFPHGPLHPHIKKLKDLSPLSTPTKALAIKLTKLQREKEEEVKGMTSPSQGNPSTEAAIGELIKGREAAARLGVLLQEAALGNSAIEAFKEVIDSFTRSLSVLDPGKPPETARDPAIVGAGRKRKISPGGGKRGGSRRRWSWFSWSCWFWV